MPNKKDTIEPIHASFDDVVSKMVMPNKKFPESLRAMHTGNFKSILDFDVECYVLDDKAKSAIVSQQGIHTLFDDNTLSTYVKRDLLDMLYKPITFQGQSGLPKFGYDASLLIDICLSILDIRHDNRTHPATYRAYLIVRLAAKIGIKELIYKVCEKKTSK